MSAAQLQLPLDEVFFLCFRIICPAIITILFLIIMQPEILLGLVALILFPSGGEANTQVHQPALLDSSVSISYSPSRKMGTWRTITWKFDKNGERLTILDNSDKPYHVYPSQFMGRLQLSDDLHTLTIINLTLEDSGIYTVEVADTNGRTDVHSFNVTVYEPIPLPVIRTDVMESTTDRCNVTLHCSVPSHLSDVFYTWKCGERDSEYEPCNTGSIIQISVPKSSKDMKFLCTAQNPVENKSVPIQVQEICSLAGELFPRRHYATAIAILVPTLFLVMVAVICIRRRYKRRKGMKEPIENKNTEMHYIEVTTHQRDSNQIVHMGNDRSTGMPPPQRTKAETLYSVLQHPAPKYT
ncbi:CD48 antigen-like [Eleutherodactylus coqui]|uniref:CD48 antigen-like n=1 Tax=Eleutherodactylus coqui TaxID=57060 RepID=UPI0034636C6D